MKARPKLTPQQELTDWFQRLITDGIFRTRRDIAQACGMDDATLSLVLSVPTRRLTTVQCLRLALATKTNPAATLRRAGRPEDADVVDALWPPTKTINLNSAERELIREWRLLNSNDKHHAGAIISILADRASARSDGPAPSVRDAPPSSSKPKRERQAAASS